MQRMTVSIGLWAVVLAVFVAPAHGFFLNFEEGVGNDMGLVFLNYQGIQFAPNGPTGDPWFYGDATALPPWDVSSWPTGLQWGTGEFWDNDYAFVLAASSSKIAFTNQDATFVRFNYATSTGLNVTIRNPADAVIGSTSVGPNLRYTNSNANGPGTIVLTAPAGETIASVEIAEAVPVTYTWIIDNFMTDATNLHGPDDLQIVKFNDVNANGVFDPDEPLLEGWTYQVSGVAPTFDVTTDADGVANLGALDDGAYTVTELSQPTGWTATTPTTQVGTASDEVTGVLYFGSTFVAPDLPPDRTSATEKGSLFVFPKVELRWDGSTGELLQDTFIDLTNDYPGMVGVQMYFVNGDRAVAEAYYPDGTIKERAHTGCNWVDNRIALTGNEPCYWSALTGLPKGVSPFTVLDPPAVEPFDPANPLSWPGRAATDGSGDRVLRGYIVGWAVNADNLEIRWNHLKGDALLLNYAEPSAWEYNSWTFNTQLVPHGEVLPEQSILFLDGAKYDFCPDMLLIDFYASQYSDQPIGTFGSAGASIYGVDTDLTLLPMLIDLRQDGEGPVITKAKFDIWNQNEVKFSGTERCISCWDQQLVSNYGVPNHFLRAHLQTNKGKARVDGMASIVCDMYDEFGYPVALSEDAALLGVLSRMIQFTPPSATPADVGRSGMNLISLGNQSGTILYDPTDPVPEGPEGSVELGAGSGKIAPGEAQPIQQIRSNWPQ